MAINLDLHDLLAFRSVAELGNFRKAAELAHITQPASCAGAHNASNRWLNARWTDQATLFIANANIAVKIGESFDRIFSVRTSE